MRCGDSAAAMRAESGPPTPGMRVKKASVTARGGAPAEGGGEGGAWGRRVGGGCGLRRRADFRDGPALLGEPANALADEGGGAPVARHVEEESGREGRAVVALQHRGREGHDLRHHGPQRELARKHQHKGACRAGVDRGWGPF